MICNLKQWPMESRSTELRPPPVRGELSADDVADTHESNGIRLLLCGRVLPVSSLPPDEYEARILAHQKRVEREMKRLEAEAPKVEPSYANSKDRRIPFGRKWQDVRVVNCARCKKLLLAESEEEYRERAIVARMRSVKNLPPPVVERIGERPYCGDCC